MFFHAPTTWCKIFAVHPSTAFLRTGKQHSAAHLLSEDNPLPGKMSFSPSEPAAQSTGAICGLVDPCGANRSISENGNGTEIHCRGCPPQSSSDKVSQDPEGLYDVYMVPIAYFVYHLENRWSTSYGFSWPPY